MSAQPLTSCVDFTRRSEADRQHALRRAFNEAASPHPFFEDKLRIESTSIFRRLKDIYQYRPGTDFHVQNRMSHTIGAQNTGEKIARALGLGQQSQDIVRAIIAAHDVGHPPFGHRGEHAIKERMAARGIVWNHDGAALRVVHDWAFHSHKHKGLNFTLAVLEGLAKRYWRYTADASEGRNFSHYEHARDELPPSILELDRSQDLRLGKLNHIEGQIACVSDWITFTGTDIEDGVTMGRINPETIKNAFPEIETTEIAQYLIEDVLNYTRRNIAAAVDAGRIKNAEDVRDLDKLVVSLSPPVRAMLMKMDSDHPKPETTQEYRQVGQMFDALFNQDVPMKYGWEINPEDTPQERAVKVAGYMTCEVMDKNVSDFAAAPKPGP